jgi:hypothetical protein
LEGYSSRVEVLPGSFIFTESDYICHMKKPVLPTLAAALVMVLAGCDQKSASTTSASTNAASSGGNPLTAPVDYLGAAAKAQQQAVKTVDTASIDRAIQMFGVEHGRNPKDLNELVQEKYMPKIPQPPYGTKLVYDANAGTVRVEKQ